jgi:mannose-6-phosphate isomerase-like protein (cupin superfamily)
MNFKIHSRQSTIFEDLKQDAFPVVYRSWYQSTVTLPDHGTHFGFVDQGSPILHRDRGEQAYRLYRQMYFSLPGGGRLDGTASSGIVITRLDYQGVFHLGGPLESKGRFAYIDGGTNSLLIPPVSFGDPCLNALYFPARVDQTWHTHPSHRIVTVVEGSGWCWTEDQQQVLQPGTVFYIPADYRHKFQTTNSKLTLVVFHPDSDMGFGDRHNPMLNRTIVEGVSASQLPQIHTPIKPK